VEKRVEVLQGRLDLLQSFMRVLQEAHDITSAGKALVTSVTEEPKLLILRPDTLLGRMTRIFKESRRFARSTERGDDQDPNAPMTKKSSAGVDDLRERITFLLAVFGRGEACEILAVRWTRVDSGMIQVAQCVFRRLPDDAKTKGGKKAGSLVGISCLRCAAWYLTPSDPVEPIQE
jgi:hypothetical protein